MNDWRLSGEVATGAGKGAAFASLAWVQAQFLQHFGITAYPGTLNLTLAGADDIALWETVARESRSSLIPPDDRHCAARVVAVRLEGCLPAVAVVPLVDNYPGSLVELVAAIHLRDHFQLADGSMLELTAGRLNHVRCVLFDLDGTLVNSLDGIYLAVSRAATAHGLQVSAADIRRALDEGHPIWPEMVPSASRGDQRRLGDFRAAIMREWNRVLDECVDIIPGLERTISLLKTAGIRLGIYTGSRGEAFLPLKRRRLLDQFDAIVTANDVAQRKPHPEGLSRCLEKLECPPEEAIYVGDSRQDMIAGRAAGMQVIGVLSGVSDSAGLSRAGADRIAVSHAALPELLLPD